MLNKKTFIAVIAVILCIFTYSCKKSEVSLSQSSNVNGVQNGPSTPPIPPTPPIPTRDTIVDSTVYVAPQVTVSTTTWVDSNGKSYGIVISRLGVPGFPGTFGAPDTSKVTINPDGSLVITLPTGRVVTVTFDPDGTPRYIIVNPTAAESRLVDAIISASKKKKKKKLEAQQQQQSHNNPDGPSFG